MRYHLTAFTLCLAALLSACGSGSSGADPATSAAPASGPMTFQGTSITATFTTSPTVTTGNTVTSTAPTCLPEPAVTTTLSVKDTGAAGDGIANDTNAIQAAVNQMAGTGGTVLVPDGVYMINALVGVQLKSSMTFRLSPGATLRALPNGSDSYRVLAIRSASNVNVVGGTIEGERAAHTGTTGEAGHCLALSGSQNIVVEGVTAKNCWGDGFYLGGPSNSKVSFCRVVADNNRRQGMSVTSADGLYVGFSVFKNTAGTLPEAGLDIEPNLGETVTNALVTDNLFDNNAGGGIRIGPAGRDAATTFVTKTVIQNNTITNNGLGSLSPPSFAIRLASSVGNTLRNNLLKNNAGIGIGVVSTTDSVVTGNTVTATAFAGTGPAIGSGIVLSEDKGTICTANNVTDNAGYGIFKYLSDALVTGNTVTGNGRVP